MGFLESKNPDFERTAVLDFRRGPGNYFQPQRLDFNWRALKNEQFEMILQGNKFASKGAQVSNLPTLPKSPDPHNRCFFA